MEGIVIDRFETVVIDDTNSRLRIVFLQQGEEFFIECEISALSAFLPFLIQASNVKQKTDNPTTILTSDAEAMLDTHGEVMLNLVGTAGAEFWYTLPQQVAGKLHVSLDEALRDQSPSTSKH